MSVSLRLFAAALIAGSAAPVFAAGTPTPATAIYQQRSADGSIVLTDRPSPTTVIERAWRVEPEDPALARQRAIDVRNAAQAVTDRVRNRLDDQQLRADDDAMRRRYAQADLDQRRAIDLSSSDSGVETGVIYTPYGSYGFRPGHRIRPHRSEGRDPRRPTPRLRGSAAPESR